MSESSKNLLKINEVSDALCHLENFLNYKWDNYSVPIIDVDFFDLFSRLVINQEVFEFCEEPSKEEVEKIISSGKITDRVELDNLNNTLLRIEKLDFNDYLLQNTLAIFKNPEFYISRLNESILHTPLNKNDLDTNLNLITLNSKKIYLEYGLANLYLAFGFYTSDNFNAPLIFIPVKLEKNDSKFKLSYDSHDKIRLNDSLELKLKENNILLPQKEITSETDMISYLTAVNKLGTIKAIITLGLFDFTIPLAFKDLKKFNESVELNNILENSDATIQFNENEIDLMDENNSFNVFDADYSQIAAIQETLLDGNIVIDAPEGSNRIETIVNLISEIIANKKTVLYVSDKLDSIHKTEKKLSEIGLEDAYIDLYGNNYNYPSFIEKITNAAETTHEIDFDKNYTDSKLNELNNLKGKLSEYSNFISTPYKRIGLTPYQIIGIMESEYGEELNDFEMKNLSNLTNGEYKEIFSDFNKLTDIYVNKIQPTSKHKFNYIVVKEIDDDELDEIITIIPNLKRELEELIKLNTEINEEFGIKKLKKLSEHKQHVGKLDSIKNSPQIMGDDYADLKKYVDSLEIFQNKTNEYGSIEDLEKLLLVEVYNTRLDLENQIIELNKLNDEITELTNLLDDFRSMVSDAGIKRLNSINEIDNVRDSLELLDKNPYLISNEEKFNKFLEDMEKYQNECKNNTPEDLLKNINKYAKLALSTTIKKINKLIEHKKSIEEVNVLISQLNASKIEIGLNGFDSIVTIDEDLKKLDILLTRPVLVDDEKAIDEFIEEFKTGANKFAENDYDAYYLKMNDDINEIQNNITDEISKTIVLETNIPTIKNEIGTILENTNRLNELLKIKKIGSIKEIDEYCDNVEILLKNPIIIEDSDKNEINAYIALLEDIQSEEEYTKLDLDQVDDLITKIIEFNKKVKKLNFENQVFRYLDLKKYVRTISNCEYRLSASPVNPPWDYKQLNKKFDIFTKEHTKILKLLSGDYKKIKKELRSYYKYDAPREDEIIHADYKNHLEIIKDLDDAKKAVLDYNKVNESMETYAFKKMLNQLVDFQDEYKNLEKEYRSLGINTNFDDALEYLVPIKLILTDIKELSKESTLKFKKNLDSNSMNINSKLKRYFPKSYFKLETNLDDLYEEYWINEKYKNLIDDGFFSNDSLDLYNNADKIEIKTILKNIKQSKSKFYYYLNLISNNIEITDSSLDFVSISPKHFSELIEYLDNLVTEINKANDLFNKSSENYKIDDIDKIIENYNELINLENVKEFVTTGTYVNTLIEYRNDFKLLKEFNSVSDINSSLIDKYFSEIWKGRITSIDELNEAFNNHKKFTKLFNDGFFTHNIFTFLEKSDNDIKSKIRVLNSQCDEISQKTNNFNEQLVFYEGNLEEITFEEYANKNKDALKTIDLLSNYNLTFNQYDKNKLVDLDKKPDLESLDSVNQLYDDLTKLYDDSEVTRYDISFASQINELNKLTGDKNEFIGLVGLRNSIENQNDIINGHFDKLWDGPTTDISIIKNKANIDKEFTKNHAEGIFSDKTANLINKNEHSFNNYKNEFNTKFEEINNQIDKIGVNPIISNEFDNELKNTEFDVISSKTTKIQNDIDKLNANYEDIKISKTFNLDEITTDINLLDEIIQSKYIRYLDNNLDDLNKSNDNLKTSLDKHNELELLKNNFDEISIDSKYFKDIYTGYDTSVLELNQQLQYNKTYEDLFNEGFFSERTNNVLKDESKLDGLNNSISRMETYIESSINSFKILDLIHNEKNINLNKSLDDALVYVTFFDDNLDELKDWFEFEKLCKHLDNEICHEFIKAINNDEIKPELINQSFSYNFANNLINEIKEEHDLISQNDIDEYIGLDKEVIKINRLRVLYEYINSIPDFTNIESENSKLMKQYQAFVKFEDLSLKDDGNIKELLDKTIEYIKAIKPIFITTPSSVFKYLSSGDFDYIIFNDVNQIPNEMAITTLLRGDKKVIIGDSKQSNSGLTNLMENKFKTKQLKWCYSANASFYNDNILNYPKQSGESNFEIIHVKDSIYDASLQINEVEAAKIVDLAIDYVNEYGFNKTLGIIAFTKAQRDHIIKLLLKKLESLPDLVQYFNPLDSFYIKYIDDVYESRDIVLASLTCGFDKNNALNLDFESENEYCFNKLMTKAFEKTIVLTNFQSADIAEENKVKLIFDYQNDIAKDFELSLFEKEVYSFLNNTYEVKKQLVDFTVDDKISIECEGENFNKFKDVRDKFRLHKELLESLGWKSLHICTSDWIADRDSYQNKLLEVINSDNETEVDEDIIFDDDFGFDFENNDEISINELKELL